MNLLPNKLKALISISALLAVLSGMALIAATPFLVLNSIANETLENKEQLDKLAALTNKINEIRSKRGKLETLVKKANVLLPGDTTGIAGANLQRRITYLVRTSGGRARSFQILQPEENQNLTRISMSLTVRTDITSLQRILYGIETGAPLTFIDDIVIRSTGSRRVRQNSTQPQVLDVTMRISGYFLKRKPAKEDVS